MKTEISRRSVLKGLAGLVGSAMVPKVADACDEDRETFLDKIKPILRNAEIVKQDVDGKIYARFDLPLSSINDISLHPQNYHFTSSDGQDTFYQTLKEALRNLQSKNTYVIEFDVKNPFNPGAISGVYTLTGKKLKGYSSSKCIDAPLEFEE